jgi:hypothetical protein
MITAAAQRAVHRRSDGHPVTAGTHAGIAVVAVICADDTDRSATETEQQLWADVDALFFWAPVYDDLVGRARSALRGRRRWQP